MPITVATLQSYYLNNFITGITLEARTHRWDVPNTIVADLTAIAAALNVPDPTTHDTTIQAAPIALRPGQVPGATSGHSRFYNDVLLHVNEGKCAGQAYLTNVQMATAITNLLAANVLPPVNTAAPVVSGTGTVGQNLTTTNGTWNYNPVAYTYQWLRDGAAILGATGSVYALVGADSTRSVRCQVRAENAAGANTANSNAIAVT